MVCDLTKFIFGDAVATREVGPVITFLNRIQSVSNYKIKNLSLDNAFDGHKMDDWALANNVKLEYRPSRRSRSVLAERYQRTIRETIDSMTPSPGAWASILQKAFYSMNTSISDSHGFQPAYLFSGHLTDPINGPTIDVNSPHAFNLRVAKATLNFQKQQRSSDYKYRVVERSQKVLVRYDHTKSGSSLNGTILSDLGENHSTVMVKLEPTKGQKGRHLPIRVHKSDILIEKTDPNYAKIFSDLPGSILPNVSRTLTD